MFVNDQEHWENAPTSLTYQWEDCASGVTDCVPIAGATDSTYTLASSDVGSLIGLQETATNAGGSTTATSVDQFGAVAPPGPVGVSIDGGDYATNTADVTLDLVWPAGTSSPLTSNDGGFQVRTKINALAAQVPWTLDQTQYNRVPEIVYVKFEPFDYNEFTDDIILDEACNPTIDSATRSSVSPAQAGCHRRPGFRIRESGEGAHAQART